MLIIIYDIGVVMKKGFIGTIFLCGMLLGCASPVKNPHPKLLYSPSPAYPYYALANRIEGDVTVRYNVGVDGKISKVWILKSEPQHLFDSAVIAAMAQWRYEINKPVQGLQKKYILKSKLRPNKPESRALRLPLLILNSLSSQRPPTGGFLWHYRSHSIEWL